MKKNLFEMFNAINNTNLNTMVEKKKLYEGIISIDETNLNRLLGVHFNAGLIIISANRHENTHEENKRNFEQYFHIFPFMVDLLSNLLMENLLK